jgi:hypothetical protein
MSATYPRIRLHELASCPKCHRLVVAWRLGESTFVWDPGHNDQADFARLVGQAAVKRQGFGQPVSPSDLPAHDCTQPRASETDRSSGVLGMRRR